MENKNKKLKKHTNVWAVGPLVHHILFPLSTYPPSTRSALHFMLTTSDPAAEKMNSLGNVLGISKYLRYFYWISHILQFGSLIAKAPTWSPEMSFRVEERKKKEKKKGVSLSCRQTNGHIKVEKDY